MELAGIAKGWVGKLDNAGLRQALDDLEDMEHDIGIARFFLSVRVVTSSCASVGIHW